MDISNMNLSTTDNKNISLLNKNDEFLNESLKSIKAPHYSKRSDESLIMLLDNLNNQINNKDKTKDKKDISNNNFSTRNQTKYCEDNKEIRDNKDIKGSKENKESKESKVDKVNKANNENSKISIEGSQKGASVGKVNKKDAKTNIINANNNNNKININNNTSLNKSPLQNNINNNFSINKNNNSSALLNTLKKFEKKSKSPARNKLYLNELKKNFLKSKGKGVITMNSIKDIKYGDKPEMIQKIIENIKNVPFQNNLVKLSSKATLNTDYYLPSVQSTVKDFYKSNNNTNINHITIKTEESIKHIKTTKDRDNKESNKDYCNDFKNIFNVLDYINPRSHSKYVAQANKLKKEFSKTNSKWINGNSSQNKIIFSTDRKHSKNKSDIIQNINEIIANSKLKQNISLKEINKNKIKSTLKTLNAYSNALINLKDYDLDQLENSFKENLDYIKKRNVSIGSKSNKSANVNNNYINNNNKYESEKLKSNNSNSNIYNKINEYNSCRLGKTFFNISNNKIRLNSNSKEKSLQKKLENRKLKTITNNTHNSYNHNNSNNTYNNPNNSNTYINTNNQYIKTNNSINSNSSNRHNNKISKKQLSQEKVYMGEPKKTHANMRKININSIEDGFTNQKSMKSINISTISIKKDALLNNFSKFVKVQKKDNNAYNNICLMNKDEKNINLNTFEELKSMYIYIYLYMIYIYFIYNLYR